MVRGVRRPGGGDHRLSGRCPGAARGRQAGGRDRGHVGRSGRHHWRGRAMAPEANGDEQGEEAEYKHILSQEGALRYVVILFPMRCLNFDKHDSYSRFSQECEPFETRRPAPIELAEVGATVGVN